MSMPGHVADDWGSIAKRLRQIKNGIDYKDPVPPADRKQWAMAPDGTIHLYHAEGDHYCVITHGFKYYDMVLTEQTKNGKRVHKL